MGFCLQIHGLFVHIKIRRSLYEFICFWVRFPARSHPACHRQTGLQRSAFLGTWCPPRSISSIIFCAVRALSIIIKKTFPVHTGESFLIYPYDTIRYYPDPGNPWEYTWVEFTAEKKLPLCSIRPPFPLPRPVCPAICPDRLRQLFADLQPLDLYHQNHNEANGILRTLLGLYADYAPAPGLPASPASSPSGKCSFSDPLQFFIMSTSIPNSFVRCSGSAEARSTAPFNLN